MKTTILTIIAMGLIANQAIANTALLNLNTDQESITGEVAQNLLNALPPTENSFYKGEIAQAVKKHFRSLVIPGKDGQPAIKISCSSAQWEYGASRISTSTLVASEAQCTFDKVVYDHEILSPLDLAAIAQKALEANKIEVSLPIEKTHSFLDDTVCNTRSC